jgi:EAL domain-containing protein (putative c-di-GMP-specific phosphodiesterase class I)
MSNGLGIEVVAEFVTSETVAETCRDLGITAIQGSFVGPTLPLNDALALD